MEPFTQPFIYFILRLILGSLFFFQSYDKIFRLKLSNVNEQVHIGASERKIPSWFTHLSVLISSYLEFFGGFLLIIGLFTPTVLIILGIHLTMVVIAFSYLKGVWDMKHVFPRLALLVTLFLLPSDWNSWSIDNLLF